MKSPWLTHALLCFGVGIFLGALILTFTTLRPGTAAPILSFTNETSEVPVHSDVPAIVPFIEIVESCGPRYEGVCVVARSAPTTTAPVVAQLRTGMVLPVATSTTIDVTGRTWYQIDFREWLRYPYRVHGTWYVAADNGTWFERPGEESISDEATTTKHILIDRSEQMLYAYEGTALVMQTRVSTGLDVTPTPRGTFTVYRKTPSRYMQGPLPGISDQYYDLPGVPWNLYFTKEGGAIHGAYWHADFGHQRSHGCVNLPLTEAQALYEWTPLGTSVLVRD